MRRDVKENYQQIASDHIAHWRLTGENPWQNQEHVAAMRSAIVKQIENATRPGDSILDAGCGMGELLLHVPDRLRYGCDWSNGYVEIANRNGIEAIEADLEDLPYPDEKFDAVVAADVLEHVVELNHVTEELLRVLRPGGHLFVRVPDEEDISVYLAPENPYRFVHLRRFDEASLRILFERLYECEIIEVSRLNKEITVVVRKPE